MTLEQFIISLGYTKTAIGLMSDDNIRFLEARWIKQREGKE